MSNTYLKKLDNFLETYLVKKAPSIPKDIKELIVKYGPYLLALSLFFSIPSLLALLGLGTLYSGFRFLRAYRFGLVHQLSILVMLVTLALQVLALPGLFKRSLSSWKLLYYVVLINSLFALITFNLAGFIIGALVGFYILFQIKPLYK